MYRRKADYSPTIVQILPLDNLIDFIENGQTNDFIAIEIMKGGNEGWSGFDKDFGEDFLDFFHASIPNLDPEDIMAISDSYGAVRHYLYDKLYSDFTALHAGSEDEANELADGFMAKLCNLLRGKSVKITFTVTSQSAVLQ